LNYMDCMWSPEEGQPVIVQDGCACGVYSVTHATMHGRTKYYSTVKPMP
jgi:hypothetical protein